MTSSDVKADTASPQPELLRVNVTGWPDMGLPGWKKWGFNLTDVLRPPRRHFIFQTRESNLFEKGGLHQTLVLKGEFYPVDDVSERKMEKLGWVAYVIGIVLIVSMLKAVAAGNGILAAVSFIVTYAMFETFGIIALKIVAGSKRIYDMEIPVDSLHKVAFLPRQGIILLSWEMDSIMRGIALKIDGEAGESFVDRLRSGSDKVNVDIYKGLTLYQPPSK